ncbi:MAG: quinoprotein relay system zinc metallohydrolase 1 [Geminicoccaceae bacterium]
MHQLSLLPKHARLPRRRALQLLAAAAASSSCCGRAFAAQTDYGLVPQEIADGLFMFRGKDEWFSFDNGGNILNTGYLLTGEGVVAFDTGPSRIYGEQMRAAIAAHTEMPVLQALVTHGHPDHFLGSQGFEGAPIAAMDGTRDMIARDGELLAANMYRLVDRWMRGTVSITPEVVLAPGRQRFGGRDVELLDLGGHTESDLALFDHDTGTLFAGDLVFFDRAPTTPHAHIPTWLASLERLRELPVERIVPGHGAVTEGQIAIDQTADYLTWLRDALLEAADRGLDMTEVMALEKPARFQRLAVLDAEFVRSIAHLYPSIERQALPRVN